MTTAACRNPTRGLRPPAPLRRGGATFTLLLFCLLLVSSGFMYFYFMRARMLERELEKWRSGVKVRESTADSAPAERVEPPAPRATPARTPPPVAVATPRAAEPTQGIVPMGGNSAAAQPTPTATPGAVVESESAAPFSPVTRPTPVSVSADPRTPAPTPRTVERRADGPIRSIYDLEEPAEQSARPGTADPIGDILRTAPPE